MLSRAARMARVFFLPDDDEAIRHMAYLYRKKKLLIDHSEFIVHSFISHFTFHIGIRLSY